MKLKPEQIDSLVDLMDAKIECEKSERDVDDHSYWIGTTPCEDAREAEKKARALLAGECYEPPDPRGW